MSGWRPDGTGITQSSDSRADDQAGDSYRVSFRHPDLPGAVVTCSSYARTGFPALPGRFYVSTDVEWLACTDPDQPAETATWHDIEVVDEDGTWDNAADAEKAAGWFAGQRLESNDIDWNGQPY